MSEIRSQVQIYNADCLDVLSKITNIRAIITDPPYMLKVKSSPHEKTMMWSDICNAAYWYSAWMQKCRETLTPDGCLWTFLNWRSLPTFQKAACDIGWSIESLLIWDKGFIGPAGKKQLRPCYEMVALLCKPEFILQDRKLRDIQRIPWQTIKPHGHPAEKPEALCRLLIEKSTEPGDTVLDPFMGSGTTGVAACTLGRHFTGIELDEKWCAFSKRRIEGAA